MQILSMTCIIDMCHAEQAPNMIVVRAQQSGVGGLPCRPEQAQRVPRGPHCNPIWLQKRRPGAQLPMGAECCIDNMLSRLQR